ncbi:hypothetical protein [Actinomadura litoris]|nr:hypothetical protein [Actinomadura litoris]
MADLPKDALTRATAQAIQWATLIGVLTAMPCIAWLWKWAL